MLNSSRIGSIPYTSAYIKEVVKHTESTKSFILGVNDMDEIWPGQFIMVWLPDYEEIPLSPSYSDGKTVRITVKAVGETTSKLLELDVGDRIYMRGPYGKGFDLDLEGNYLLVGGGYGAAPIIYAAHILIKRGLSTTYVEGVKTASEQLFIDEANKLGINSVLVTEDGSSSIKGLVTEYIIKIINNYDMVLACGPEAMLNKILNICNEYGVNCQLSYEKIVKCGIGICGSCVLDDTGLLICRDGPVFHRDTLLKYQYISKVNKVD